MRIIVAGGCGFIGRHLCKQLLENGHTVICVDNLQTSSISNIIEFTNNPRFKLITSDIVTDTLQFIEGTIDQIYHLACPASPIHYQHSPIKTLETCFKGTQNLLELAMQKKATILYTSTSEIYGDPDVHPQNESYNGNVKTTSLRACYDEGKRVGETLCTEYNRVNKVDIRIARIFNTYGPYLQVNDGRVVSNFISQSLNGRNITIYGNGTQTRSFCFVDDTVKGLMLLMNYTGEQKHTPINIGNPDEITILQLAEKISEITQNITPITFKPLPEADPAKRQPNISKAIKLLKWTPTINLQDGLITTINYFRHI